jgi:4-alpha-glucanotransferase
VDSSLLRLAQSYGVQTAYYDLEGRRRVASAEALLLTLKALGAPVETLSDAPAALRAHEQANWRQPVPPVAVAWDSGSAEVPLRIPASRADARLACRLQLEDGRVLEWTADLASVPTLPGAEVEGVLYVIKAIPLPNHLPMGYHTLTVEGLAAPAETMVISAPLRAYAPEDGDGRRLWGVFMPLYALHTQRSWGAGDLSDLETLMEWTSNLGGQVVATLPLLAAFLEGEPFEPSPYSPVSRLFWNEFYLDLTRVPELARCPDAQSLLESSDLRRQVQELRNAPLVDYRRQTALKRQVLEKLAHCFFTEPAPERRAGFDRFLVATPAAQDYARFRAATEHYQSSWQTWPQNARDGRLGSEDCDDPAVRYHLYAQWQMEEQIASIARNATRRGETIYLDLPVGVSSDGYDIWRERDAFVSDVTAGAPPDGFFARGQDWGFSPPHPVQGREQRHRYFIQTLRHHLKHARLLRVDHIMGLHRIFSIPKGLDATQGVYIRYRGEELYAILCVESHRRRAMIVGENLGTVPSHVNETMQRHNVYGMYVAQFHMRPRPDGTVRPPPARTAASVNTHDMPTFNAFWNGSDIDDRLKLGMLDNEEAQWERDRRRRYARSLIEALRRGELLTSDTVSNSDVLRAILSHLGSSKAKVVLATLEDLWGETRPQNTPGTQDEVPNWRRRARRSWEEFSQMPEIVETLKALNGARNLQPKERTQS